MAYTTSTICHHCGKVFTKGPFQGDPRKEYPDPEHKVTMTQLTCPHCEKESSYEPRELVIQKP